MALAEGHFVEEALRLVPDAALPAVIGRVHEEGERHLEGRIDFFGIEVERKAGAHHRKHRRDAVAAAGDIVGQPSDYLDMVRGKSDFLDRLAYRRRCGRAVLRVDSAAGKGDLA